MKTFILFYAVFLASCTFSTDIVAADEMIKSIRIILPMSQKKIIGEAEYCAIGDTEILCTDHTMAQCLRTANLTAGVTSCETYKDMKNLVIKNFQPTAPK